MIFIYENQLPFINPKRPSHKNVSAYINACLIYKCLYRLEEDILNKIDEIFYITDTSVKESLLVSGLKNYSANVDDYKNEKELIIEIFDQFPEVEDLLNDSKRSKVEELVKNSRVRIIEDSKGEKKHLKEFLNSGNDYLIYLPFAKKLSSKLINSLSDSDCYIFTDSKSCKLRLNVGYVFLNKSFYIEIEEKIRGVQNHYYKKNSNPINNRHFRLPEFLGNFDNGFFEKIVDLQSEYHKRMHVLGKDSFIAKKAIDRLLSGVDKYYYYLPQDLYKIEDESLSMVIYNFDSLDDPKGYKRLYDKVKNINDTFYVVLQAMRNVNSQYFSYFRDVDIPKDKEIREKLSGLFLSLLIEKRLFDDRYWKLFPIVEFNLLASLIPKDITFEIINVALDSFEKINFDDLVNNSLFWYSFQYKINEIAMDIKQTELYSPKKKIVFERLGENWHISGIGKLITLQYSQNIGIKYLVAIIKSQQKLSSKEVRGITLKYNGDIQTYDEREKNIKLKKIFIEDLNDADRKTINSAISSVKKINSDLKFFIKKHFTFSAHRNYFDHKNEIEIKIIDSNWQDSFLS